MKEAEADTDTEGDEMTVQEATETLRLLASSPNHSPAFYTQLSQALQALPGLQNLDDGHPTSRSCVALADHLVCGVADSKTRALACGPLAQLVKNRPFVLRVVSSTFAMTFLVRALEEDEDDAVRATLLWAIRLLSVSRAARSELLRCGGMEAMLAVVGDDKSGELSKTHVVFTLRRLCKMTQAREQLARLAGVEPLSKYFFQLDNHAVQKSLAGLLQTLATNPEVKTQLAELGAVPRLVALLTMSQMHMLKYVICIVRNVACNHDENRVLIAKAGGIRALLLLLPQVSVKLQQKIAGALQNLATNRDNRQQIVQVGGVPVLIELIKTSDEKLQKYGLGGLKRLVYNSREATLAFQKQGGLVPLLALLESDDVSVLKNAIHALNRVRHFIGREPIEALGGFTAMYRLLTCQHEKIRLLAKRSLGSMDEDLSYWICRIQTVALRVLMAARVLLNPHCFVMPDAASGGGVAVAAAVPADLGRRRISTNGLLKTFRVSRTRSEDAMSVGTPPGSPAAAAAAAPASPMSPILAGLRGMTPENNALLTALGYGETYWHLRAGTPHMLPIPVLQIILIHLDPEHLLSRGQMRQIFKWARDRASLGKPIDEFLSVITNNSMALAPAPAAAAKKNACIIC